MKKLFALLLALVMVLSLAACGGDKDPTPSGNGDNTPSSSGQQEQPSSTSDEDDGGGATSYEWPENASAILWTGSGKIVGTNTLTYSRGEVEIFYDTATLEEVGAYIEMLKGRGVTYYGEGDEPALAFEDGEFSWAGNSGAIKIYLLEEPDTTAAADGKYQLKITVMPDIKF